MNLQIKRKYSITIEIPLKNHGAHLTKNSFEKVYNFFEEKKCRTWDAEKMLYLEFILKVMDAAKECGVCDTIEEVVCNRNTSTASITLSFLSKVSLKHFEEKLDEILR